MHFSTRISIIGTLLAATLSVSATSQGMPPKVQNGHGNGIPALAPRHLQSGTPVASDIFMQKRLNAAGNGLARETSVALPRQSAPQFKAQGTMPDLYGCVRFQSDWDQFDKPGLFTVPTSTSMTFERMLPDEINATYGGVAIGDLYYTCHKNSFMGYTFVYYDGYSLTTGQPMFSTSASYPSVTLTYDPVSEHVYGIVEVSGALQLAAIDFQPDPAQLEDKTQITLLGNLPGRWTTIACSATGELYGIREYFESNGVQDVCVKSELYRISKENASVTLVGDTGMKPQYRTDATIDPRTGRMFWALSQLDDKSYLTEVDLATGQASYICQFPNDQVVVGLQTAAPAALDKAPASVTDLAAHFSDGTLTGSLTFTAPGTLYDGTPATGALTAIVMSQGTELARQRVTCGAASAMAVTVPQGGLYDFTVVVANNVGNSPAATVRNVFVGKDTPVAPEPVLTYTDGVMTLSWEPVSASVNGGYVNTLSMLYTVRRMPDNIVVADRIAATSFSEQCPEATDLTYRSYSVTAEYDGIASAPGISNTITMGGLTPPFASSFDQGLDGFTIVDANGDGISFTRQDALVLGCQHYVRINNYGYVSMDDWLLTPPLRLQRGNAYKFSFKAYTASDPAEKFEVKYGRGTSVDALTQTLLPPTEVISTSGKEYTLTVTPSESGIYTIGLHGISPMNTFYLAFSNFSLTASFSAELPSTVTALQAAAAPRGALSATVSMKAPTTAISGNSLTALEKVELFRDGQPIKTFHNPAPGATLIFTDNVGSEGSYTYTATATNSEGTGDPVSASVYIGTGIPVAPAEVRLDITDNPGEVLISWDAVTANTHGNEIDPAALTYTVSIVNGALIYDPVATGVTGTTYRYTPVEPGEQKFLQYAVTAVAPAGTSDATLSAMKPVGTPATSFHEGCSAPDQAWRVSGSTSTWTITGEYDTGIPTQDGDNGYFAMAGQENGSTADLFTGLISLAGEEHPALSIFTFPMGADDTNTLRLFITDIATGTETKIYDAELNTLPVYEEWNRIMIRLDEYAGKLVTLRIQGQLNKYSFMLVDNISLTSIPMHDIAALKVSAPVRAAVGQSFTASVTVRNEGALPTGDFTVQLFADGELTGTRNAQSLDFNSSAVYDFEVQMPEMATTALELHATVTSDTDETAANNTCASVTVMPEQSCLPAPTALAAESNENGLTLTWTEPDISRGVAFPYTEDFENAESWAHELDGWEFVDLDKSPVGGIMGVTTPFIDYSISTLAFYILDNVEPGFESGFDARSGHKALASLFRWDNGQNDDWAVSPTLDGSAQTIRLFARSYDPSYPEKIEIWYTTSRADSFDQADYEMCATFDNLPGKFTEYEAELPEGATHFAIRNCATGAYLLLVDDVTFRRESNRTPVSLLGYDIWRDGVRLNDALLTSPGYTDSAVQLGEHHSYMVTATYDKGVSAPSAPLDVVVGALCGVTVSDISVTVTDSRIVVTGAEGLPVSISGADGRLYYAGIPASTLTVSVPVGVYVVTTPGTTAKVMVR